MIAESPDSLEALARRAANGDGSALQSLVESIQDDVYRIAMRMLWHPQDAEDATQEILFKVVTSVATFRGESTFRTWALRIASNHLLNVKRSRVEERNLTFEAFGADLVEGLADAHADGPDQALLVEEVKIGCTQAMLLCLDRNERIAYILGDVFELRSDMAAQILDIEPPAFRKRLSRARGQLRSFMRTYCGLLDEAAPCSCARRVDRAIALGRVDPHRLLFAGAPHNAPPVHGVQSSPSRHLPVTEAMAEMESFHEMAAIHRSLPQYRVPDAIRDSVRRVLQMRKSALLD